MDVGRPESTGILEHRAKSTIIPIMLRSELLDETRTLLDDRDLTLLDISARTGINFHWLNKFQQGKFADPGVKKIETLHRFLTGNGEASAT